MAKKQMVNFQKLKVPKLTDDINEIMLITTKCRDFGFESKKERMRDPSEKTSPNFIPGTITLEDKNIIFR